MDSFRYKKNRVYLETRTKASKVLSRETNAILFYTTKIICQIYSDVTGAEVERYLKDIQSYQKSKSQGVILYPFFIMIMILYNVTFASNYGRVLLDFEVDLK